MSTGITKLDTAETKKAEATAVYSPYYIRVLIALDVFINVIFNGNLDETLSARSARAATEGKRWGILLSKFLDLFQRNHGAQAVASDLTRAKEVEYLENTSGDITP